MNSLRYLHINLAFHVFISHMVLLMFECLVCVFQLLVRCEYLFYLSVKLIISCIKDKDNTIYCFSLVKPISTNTKFTLYL